MSRVKYVNRSDKQQCFKIWSHPGHTPVEYAVDPGEECEIPSGYAGNFMKRRAPGMVKAGDAKAEAKAKEEAEAKAKEEAEAKAKEEAEAKAKEEAEAKAKEEAEAKAKEEAEAKAERFSKETAAETPKSKKRRGKR